ncbi:hypothetical protein [Helicobacter sp. MIT 99-5507]|uniref:hypothetical protein n=1 Tax=Helicobacter sp. MIT 99-5507 TaxID=152489 RepID=UPI000E1E824E|nr:hypothetical protein [Helicobacter sp. MIT 99-5507]RDU57448.1 hypothetical protein CQA42_05865 [Helicobacter sp. MIT 99-5507]
MRILLLSLLIINISFANDNVTIELNTSANNIVDNNATAPVNNSASLNNQTSSDKTEIQDDVAISADEKLKNDIITFDRIDYIKEGSRIDDPFIYVYPQSKDDLESILKAEQAILVLNGIFENKASINNTWVGEDDIIEGWTVSNIQQDRVELKFRTQTRVLYVYANHNNIEIK